MKRNEMKWNIYVLTINKNITFSYILQILQGLGKLMTTTVYCLPMVLLLKYEKKKKNVI